MTKQKKEDTIHEIQEHLTGASAVVFADYRGLSAAQMETLRHNVYETGANLHVFKNSLTKLALERAGYDTPEEDVLTGPTIALFSDENFVEAFKALAEFAKENELPTIKGGYMATQVLAADKINAIAMLPPLEVLQAKLLGQLNAPITGLVHQLKGQMTKLVYTLEAIKKQKS